MANGKVNNFVRTLYEVLTALKKENSKIVYCLETYGDAGVELQFVILAINTKSRWLYLDSFFLPYTGIVK